MKTFKKVIDLNLNSVMASCTFFHKSLSKNNSFRILKKEKRNAIKDPKNLATRKCSEMTLSALTKQNHNLIGGSADLAGSNNTKTKHQKIIKPGDFNGDYIHLSLIHI